MVGAQPRGTKMRFQVQVTAPLEAGGEARVMVLTAPSYPDAYEQALAMTPDGWELVSVTEIPHARGQMAHLRG